MKKKLLYYAAMASFRLPNREQKHNIGVGTLPSLKPSAVGSRMRSKEALCVSSKSKDKTNERYFGKDKLSEFYSSKDKPNKRYLGSKKISGKSKWTDIRLRGLLTQDFPAENEESCTSRGLGNKMKEIGIEAELDAWAEESYKDNRILIEHDISAKAEDRRTKHEQADANEEAVDLIEGFLQSAKGVCNSFTDEQERISRALSTHSVEVMQAKSFAEVQHELTELVQACGPEVRISKIYIQRRINK